LLLHHIGLLWSVKFKTELKGFLQRAWKPTTAPMSAEGRKRRETFLGFSGPHSIASNRRGYQHKYAFLGQLVGDVREGAGSYDDDGQSDARRATNAKQNLLDHLNADMLIGRALHGSFTVVLSDFEWFGPSLDFGILLSVLEFFGVPASWLSFFRTFLEVPITFKGDPAHTEPRKRRRGTSIAHSLSTLMGESLLFVMDFAVNQRANGLFIYRIHDDLWLWDHDAERVLAGWNEMQQFAKLAGLTFNMDKTGSATIGGKHLPGFPAGHVRWGFLVLDANEGKFIVDDAMVDKHIVELRRQLSTAQSVFGVVNRYSFYIRFIVRNLGGRPSNSFGEEHIYQIIATLNRVQRSVFEGDDILGHLKKMVNDRFGVSDAPLGWYFMPNGLGGLGLHNPFIELLALHAKIPRKVGNYLRKALESDADDFRRSQEAYTAADVDGPKAPWDMSFEEYASGRENASFEWNHRYDNLLKHVDPADVTQTSEVSTAIAVLCQNYNGTFSQYTNFYALSFYDKWIMTLYCAELTSRFGSFAIVDPALIPIGMLQVLQGTKVEWEQ
jgi:hypothetical protein